LKDQKNSDNDFIITKRYAKNLINKLDVFEKYFSTKKQIFLVSRWRLIDFLSV
jgi:hypothetical protein